MVTFAVGASLGARIPPRRAPRAAREQVELVHRAACLAIALLAVTLAVFIAQLVSRFGLHEVLRVSAQVKGYLSSGEAPFSGTYVAVAIAATVICALAAALMTTRGRRLRWLVAAGACAGSVYFSTGRAFIAVALIAGLATIALAWGKISRRWMIATASIAVVAIFVSFVAVGSLLGKTYGNSDISKFDNFFSRHPDVSWLALPYQDMTAGTPALDALIEVSPTWGIAHGCATAPIACGLLRKLGAPVVRVPVTGPFTKAPLQWNAYTFLDRFLIDGGTALVLLLVAIAGLAAGFLWVRARGGSVVGIVAYGIVVPALVGAYRQNLVELVGIAAVVGIGLVLVARMLSGLTAPIRRRLASGVT